MHKIWTWVIILAAGYIILKMFKPAAFSGVSSQRGEFGTGTGLYGTSNAVT